MVNCSFSYPLVTGGAGFIGSHVIDLLLQQQSIKKITVLELKSANTEHLTHSNIEIIYGDICDPLAVQKAMQGCDIVFHLAAYAKLWAKDNSIFDKINHQGTINLLSIAKQYGIKKFIHVSSEMLLLMTTTATVINETTEVPLKQMVGPYCKSKWLAEKAVLQAATDDFTTVIVTPAVPLSLIHI